MGDKLGPCEKADSRIMALEDSLQAAIVEIRAWHKQAGTTAEHSSVYTRICIVLGSAATLPHACLSAPSVGG